MLKDKVSQWDRKSVETHLRIYYHNDYSETVSDLLEKVPKIGELSEDQKVYCEEVKGYLGKIDGQIATMHKLKFRPEKFYEALNEISEMLDQENEPNETFMKRAVMKFLLELNTVGEHVRNSDRAYECGFTSRLFGAFAEMCCLRCGFSLGKGDYTIWRNFKGLKKVTSEPDIRLYKYGIKTTKTVITDSKILVSVVEVKEDPIRPFGESEFDSLTERLESSHLSSSASSLSLSGTEESRKPPIEGYLSNKRVLGQHAGELLLDLHKFLKDVIKKSTLTMPGMIVDGTKVVFTLLEITKDHLQKLEENQELDENDKAVIYYSQPFDMLYSDERSILVDNFMRLNNIEFG